MKLMRRLISMIVITFVALIGMLFIVSYVSRGNNQASSLFGVSSYVVLSDSMVPRFSSGAIIIIARTDPANLREGDIITFISRDPLTFGEIITHQIEEIIEIEGSLNFVTKGINLNSIDPTPVSEQEVLGRLVFHIPNLGFLVSYLQTTQGFFLLFVLPMSLLIVIEVVRFLKYYRLYVKEKIINSLATQQATDELSEEEKIKALEDELEKLRKKPK